MLHFRVEDLLRPVARRGVFALGQQQVAIIIALPRIQQREGWLPLLLAALGISERLGRLPKLASGVKCVGMGCTIAKKEKFITYQFYIIIRFERELENKKKNIPALKKDRK